MEIRKTYAIIGKNIVFKIANKIILDDINIAIEKQSIYAVLGENDSGKSVLLKCLVGILKLDGGDVRLSNDVSSVDRSNVASRPNIGFSSQNFELPGPIRIYQLLNYISVVNGLNKHQIIERYETIATMIEVPVSDTLVSQLRHCQRKVLSLVLAVIHEPELIFLDDITGGMDIESLNNIWTLLTYINESRKCTIIVSANNHFSYMESSVTHIGILVNGKIVEEDTTINLINKYEVSNIDGFLIKIILIKDDQTATLENTRKPLDIKGHTTHKDTSSLNSIFIITENYASGKRESVLQTLIHNNFWTFARIKLMPFAVLVCMVVLPLTVHFAFSAYPQNLSLIAVHNEEARMVYTQKELGEYDQQIEAMSYVFTDQYLTKSFRLIYISKENIVNFGDSNSNYECLLHFNHNYTSTLILRMEGKIIKNADFENSKLIIKMSIIDGRRAANVKSKLLEHYKDFLSDYTHRHKILTDINYESIKYNYTKTSDDNMYTICSRFVNSGMIVILAFTFHSLIAVQLLRITSKYYYTNEWTLHLSRLVIEIPAIIVCNAFTVVYIHVLYNVKAYHGYLFLCLLLESICGMNLGHLMCLFTKNHLNVIVMQYFQLTICIYISGLWWPTSGSLGLKNMIIHYLPISQGNFFIRNLIEKQYFDVKLLVILFCWTILLMIITAIGIVITNNAKKK